MRLRVANDSSIRVFSDPWIPMPLTFLPITTINGNDDVRVAGFINQRGELDINLASL